MKLKPSGTLGPNDLVAIANAYDLAIMKIADAGGFQSELSAREIKEHISAAILSAVRQGLSDPEKLKVAALDKLRPSV